MTLVQRQLIRVFTRFAFPAIGLALADVPAFAQDGGPRLSIGGFVSGLGLSDDSGRPKTSAGFGSSLAIQLEGPLALEGRIVWFPSNEAVEYESQGGTTLGVMAGVRGTFVDSRRVRLDGVLQPGIIRFSRTASGHPDGSTTIGAGTRLALNLGAGITLLPHSRVSPRVDVGTTFLVVPGATIYAAPGGLPGVASSSAFTSAKVTDTFHIFAGINYRLHTGRESSTTSVPNPNAARRLTVGAQFTAGVRVAIGDLSPVRDPGGGALVSYRLTNCLSAEGAFNLFTAVPTSQTPWDGGRLSQVLGGVKVGLRRQRLGIFAKARAGVNSHSAAFQRRDTSPRKITTGRSTGPVLDLGGIVEVDAGGRSVLHLEAGHLTSFYRARSIVLDGVTVEQGSAPSTGAIQIATGIGWRF